MDRLIVVLLWTGAIGFLSMFVFLAIGLPATIPVAMQLAGIVGGGIAVVKIIAGGRTGDGWNRRR